MNQLVLSAHVARVKDALQKKGLAFEIKEFSESTRTANEATIGGIPPLENEKIHTVFIDQDLLDFEILWAAAATIPLAGEHQTLLTGCTISPGCTSFCCAETPLARGYYQAQLPLC